MEVRQFPFLQKGLAHRLKGTAVPRGKCGFELPQLRHGPQEAISINGICLTHLQTLLLQDSKGFCMLDSNPVSSSVASRKQPAFKTDTTSGPLQWKSQVKGVPGFPDGDSAT